MLSIIMIVVMLCNACMTAVLAISIESQVDIAQDMRRTEIFNMRINELENQANYILGLSGEDAIDVQISQASTIYDFAGNPYTLVECSPSGYMIYHDESAVFVEASVVAISPYAGLNGTKIYGGPNEYYTVVENEDEMAYQYTKTNEMILSSDLDKYSEVSERIYDTLMENQNIAVLNYVENNQPLNFVSPETTEIDGITLVKDFDFLANLICPGYAEIEGAGICGYIAATMLLAYEQYANGTGTFDEEDYWWDSLNGGYVIDATFTRNLYDLGTSLGYGTSTTSVEIHYTVKKYLENLDIAATHTSLYAPFANNIAIGNKIKDDRPVIWFGRITQNSMDGNNKDMNHAILVYGYDYSFLSGYGFIAHFGWDFYSIVSFSGLLGSMYTFTIDE